MCIISYHHKILQVSYIYTIIHANLSGGPIQLTSPYFANNDITFHPRSEAKTVAAAFGDRRSVCCLLVLLSDLSCASRSVVCSAKRIAKLSRHEILHMFVSLATVHAAEHLRSCCILWSVSRSRMAAFSSSWTLTEPWMWACLAQRKSFGIRIR
jgi:hypothetical protein